MLGLHDTPEAHLETVTTELSTHNWVHFSCHGRSYLGNPSAGHLQLVDGPLTVMKLSEARIKGAELAFLSACTTVRTGVRLPDEPIHLAAACQLAGYRDVIAALWKIDDTDAASLANTFYTTIDEFSLDSAATALHYPVRRLRSIYRNHPSRWAPYVHTGA